jgi:hypothetical protein
MQEESRLKIERRSYFVCYVVFDPRIQEYTSGRSALHSKQAFHPIFKSLRETGFFLRFTSASRLRVAIARFGEAKARRKVCLIIPPHLCPLPRGERNILCILCFLWLLFFSFFFAILALWRLGVSVKFYKNFRSVRLRFSQRCLKSSSVWSGLKFMVAMPTISLTRFS